MEKISAYATSLEGFQPHTNTVSLSPSAEGFFWAASPARFDPLERSLTEVGFKGREVEPCAENIQTQLYN